MHAAHEGSIIFGEEKNKNGELLKLRLHCNHRRHLVATIRLLLCSFFPISFSSRKKVNELKENLPCRKTGFRREAHTRARQRSGRPTDR